MSQETFSTAKNNCLDSSCCFILFLPHRKPDAAHSEVLKPCQAGGGVTLLLFNCHHLGFDEEMSFIQNRNVGCRSPGSLRLHRLQKSWHHVVGHGPALNFTCREPSFFALPMITTRSPFLTLGTSLSISKKVQLRCWPSSPVSSKCLLLLLNLAAPPEDSIPVPRVPCTLKSTGQGKARPAHSFT